MTFAPNETHAQDAVQKLAAPFWGKPRWAALLTSFTREVQEIENAARDMLAKRTLAIATGVRLAVLGKLVGQIDPGLGEEVFRTLIRVRIRINRSNGSRNDVIEVLQLLGIPLAQRQITNSYPAKIRVDLTGALPLPIELLTQLLNDTCSAGVGCIVVFNPDGVGAKGFCFSNNTTTPGVNDAWANQGTGAPRASVFQV